MNYKELLESGEPVYRETTRFKHFKNPVTSERYFSNYLSYKRMPSQSELREDLTYLAQEQEAYPTSYAFLFFSEKEEWSPEIRNFLEREGFETAKHLIFTNSVDQIQLRCSDLGGIRILELDASYLDAYLAYKYQDHLQYGQVYADQILADNKANLFSNGSNIFLALDGERIIGDLTVWYLGDYVEIDDFSVQEAYRGRGIGTALQRAALAGQQKVMLIAEEENQAMYRHQGYEEVSWYWTALQSDSR